MNRQQRRAMERIQQVTGGPRHATAKPYDTMNLGEKVAAQRIVLSAHEQQLKAILRWLSRKFPQEWEERTETGLVKPPGYQGNEG